MEPYEQITNHASFMMEHASRDKGPGLRNLSSAGKVIAEYNNTGERFRAYTKTIYKARHLQMLNHFLSLPDKDFMNMPNRPSNSLEHRI